MSGTVSKGAKPATRRPDTSVGKSRRMRRSISPTLLKFREIFPRQTALELAVRTGASVRHCERALSGRGALGEKFLWALLHSKDFGRAGYLAGMAGCRHAWFVQIEKQIVIGDAMKLVTEARRDIEQSLLQGAAE